MDDFQLGPWIISPSLGRLRQGETQRGLSRKPMGVLLRLAEQPGSVVHKEELIANAWEGDLASDEALATVVYELRKALGDEARNPIFVETIRGGGYRLLVTPTALPGSGAEAGQCREGEPRALPPAAPTNQTTEQRAARRPLLRALAATAMLALAAGVILLQSPWWAEGTEGGPAVPAPALSLAVMPLESLSQGEECRQELYAGNLTDMLVANLAGLGELRVVAAADQAEPGRLDRDSALLSADLLLEGSVLRSGDRLWVSAQLRETASGATVWGANLQRPILDQLGVQAEMDLAYQLAHQVLASIDPTLHSLPESSWQEPAVRVADIPSSATTATKQQGLGTADSQQPASAQSKLASGVSVASHAPLASEVPGANEVPGTSGVPRAVWMTPGEVWGGERQVTPDPRVHQAHRWPSSPWGPGDPLRAQTLAAATESYRLGTYFLRQGTAQSLDRARHHFTRAAEQAPNFAMAHVGLAETHLAELADLPADSRDEAVDRAQAASEAALDLDRQLAEAHASLATVYFRHRWDRSLADHHFRLAAGASQCSLESQQHVGSYFSAVGRHEEAIATLSRLVSCEPASKEARLSLAWSLYLARRYEEALAELARARELDATFLPVSRLESEVLLAIGRPEEAVRACQRVLDLAGSDPSHRSALSRAYEEAGLEGMLRCLLELAVADATEGPADLLRLATLEARLGRAEAALDWLHQAAEQRHHDLVWISVHPAFDGLREHVAYRDLLRDLGLEI